MGKKTFEALQAAIKFEEDGRAFFLAASKKTAEKFGKSTFLGFGWRKSSIFNLEMKREVTCSF